MDWATVLAEIDVFLSDDKIRCDVAGFLEAIEHKLELDEEVIAFPTDTQALTEERMLVRNARVKGGGYFLVKCRLCSKEGE